MNLDEALLALKNAGMSDSTIEKHRETIARITSSPEDIACYTEFAIKLYTGEVKNPLISTPVQVSTTRTYPWDSYGG